MVDFAALSNELSLVGARLVEPVRTLLPFAAAGPGDAEPDTELDLVIEDGHVWFEPPARMPASPVPFMTVGERKRVRFEDLPGNQLHEMLRGLDLKLNPTRGLRRLAESGAFVPVDARLTGRCLLLVHGTFSSSDSIVERVVACDPEFLRWAAASYDHVLTYDYATTSQQAIAGAMTLARLVRAHVDGPVDVISHSQGGLVTRFWLECFAPERLAASRAVFVAGTLAGTSLAAPGSLRRTLDYLANVGWMLRKGSQFAALGVPVFSAVAAIFGVLEKSVRFVSGTPLIDAGVAIVPGLVGMSRASTNAEMLELRAAVTSCPPGYCAVTGDFEPVDPAWKFWRHWKLRLADSLTDVLFSGPNDLVVDTDSQTSLSDTVAIEGSRVHNFAARRALVHHTNYFEQAETLGFIRGVLART